MVLMLGNKMPYYSYVILEGWGRGSGKQSNIFDPMFFAISFSIP